MKILRLNTVNFRYRAIGRNRVIREQEKKKFENTVRGTLWKGIYIYACLLTNLKH